jgi:anti-sigma factor RsiW
MDDTVLMAYVDGELPPRERDEVEKQMAASPEVAEVAERVALFEASRLPYREAFAHQKLPPVPERLTKSIEAMTCAQTARPANRNPNEPVAHHDKQLPPSAPLRSRLRVAPAWVAVAFIAGACFTGGVLRFAPSLSGAPSTLVAANAAPWVQAVVGYQQLYSRETLAQPVADVESVVEAIRREDGLAVRIPDLREAGLTFKRVQRLRFQGRPLIQIAYLPEKGAPVALCIIKQVQPDQPIASQRIADMNVVTWRQSELAYALVGDSSGVDLTALGKQISDRSIDALFGKAETSAYVLSAG